MNNATHESSFHPIQAPQNHEQDVFGEPGREEPLNPVEQKEITQIMSQLDTIRYSPRAATIRAIMKYAHEKKMTIH